MPLHVEKSQASFEQVHRSMHWNDWNMSWTYFNYLISLSLGVTGARDAKFTNSWYFWELGQPDKTLINQDKKNAYRGKIHCLACCSSPPLWYAHLSSDPTHWGSLISYPVYGHISTWLALIETSRHYTRSELLVGHIFNPWHSSIVDIGLVTGIDVIDSNLHLDGFVGVEHKWSETNNLTVRVS